MAAGLVPLLAFQLSWLNRPETFAPSNRLSGIGVAREEISDAVLARRTELMIESQTFAILRDPRALSGAQRITSPKLQKIFNAASSRSGLPASFIAAIAYLESWGIANAESPAGPKGIMQVAHGTAGMMGLKIVYAKRYKTTTQRKQVKNRKGKLVWQNRRVRIPYTVLVRDERLIPEKAVPAAAQYLARLEQRYGGRDWAVWAYHCGEGCTAQVRNMAERAEGVREPITVPKVFFNAHPARNRDLYEVLQSHMERDYSPTYWFRITRAEQLLKLYASKPDAFKTLFDDYRNRTNPDQRAPHRLSVWLKPEDLAYRSCEDLRREQGKSLVRALDDSRYFGFSLANAIGERDPQNRQYYLQAAPSVIGTIAYIAFETRRLHQAMKTRAEKFSPLEITALVEPLDYEEQAGRKVNGKLDSPAHCTGQVFDIDVRNLPAGQREALEFVLTDLGWDGYLGFVREEAGSTVFHVGAAPSARDFFTRVYYEAVDKNRNSN